MAPAPTPAAPAPTSATAPRIAVVSADNRSVRWADRREVHEKQLPHRTIQVLLTNRAGELLIQKRHRDKLTFPGHWDVACAGHVEEPDYTDPARPDLDLDALYERVARREIKEELGVDIEGDPIAGDPIAGDPIEGDPIAGDPIEGDRIEGDRIEGDRIEGGPIAGDAARRPARGGLDLLARFGPEPGVHYEHLHLFRATHEGPFVCQPDEVEQVRFVDRAAWTALLQDARDGREKVCPSLVWFVDWAIANLGLFAGPMR